MATQHTPLALFADAGHNLSDVLGLLPGLECKCNRPSPPPTKRYTGLRSSSILAALLNAIVLLLSMGAIGWEAIRRFSNPAQWLELRSLVLRWSGCHQYSHCSHVHVRPRLKHPGSIPAHGC